MSKKSKREKHAEHQASYMERKRAEGLEWLAIWVPAEALADIKLIAKAAQLPGAPAAQPEGADAPTWALRSQILLDVWTAARAAERIIAAAEAAAPAGAQPAESQPAESEPAAKPKSKKRKGKSADAD